MIVTLRKFLFLVLMVLAMLAGTLGLTVRAVTASLANPNYTRSIQTHNNPYIVCPPPPYEC